jgi:hypothetical protein
MSPFHSGCTPACHVSVYDDDKGSAYSPSQHKKKMIESEGLDDDEKWIQRSIFADFSLGLTRVQCSPQGGVPRVLQYV